MAMTINTNNVSINAQRNLGLSGSSLSTTMQRLSSGLRVNSAKDDAAGLAIAERMNAQAKGLAVASRNANDGISLAQTAEGALGKVGDMLQRMRELAVQSSNATNSKEDREALQAEVAQLSSEIDRVAKTTSFNGRKILDGSFTGGVFQVGAGAGDNITIAGTTKATAVGLGDVTFGSSTSKNLVAANVKDFDQALTGVKIKVGTEEVALGDMKATSSGQARLGQLVSAINEKTADTGVTAFLSETATAGTFTIALKSARGDTVSLSGLESLEKAAGVPEAKAYAKAELDAVLKALNIDPTTLEDKDAADEAIEAVVTEATKLLAKMPGYDSEASDPLDDDAHDEDSVARALVTAINTFAEFVTTDYDPADDADGLATALETLKDLILGETVMGSDEVAEITTNLQTTAAEVLALGKTATYEDVNEAAVAFNEARTTFGDTARYPAVTVDTLTESSTPEAIAAVLKKLQDATDTLGLNVNSTEVNKHTGIDTVNISTQEGAWEAIKKIDSALDQVNAARGELGALQTRFEKSIENIDIQSENITAARGRIVDTDFASETANLSRAQILQQAGTAMVAQANQLPQNVLSLLR